jgi:DNA polymerase
VEKVKENFEGLRDEIKSCQKCELCRTRKNPVFGEGDENARILFVGEAPGRVEDEKGMPFVGHSGKLLDRMLAAVGLNRNEGIFITNIIKCRPPNNMDPVEEQQKACSVYLKRQIELIDPKIIICLGRIAAYNLLGPEYRVTKDHGRIQERDGVYVMGMFHPAALLRSNQYKEEAFKDFLILKEFLKRFDGPNLEDSKSS